MEVRYANWKVERLCTEKSQMRRKFGSEVAKKLKLRIVQLRRVESFDDLRLGPGKWEQLTGDRRRQWSAHLTPNWRLIVKDLGGNPAVVEVFEVIDYH